MNYLGIFPVFVVLAVFGSLISVVLSFATIRRKEIFKKGLKFSYLLSGIALAIVILSSLVIVGSYGLVSMEDIVFCISAALISAVIFYFTKMNYRKNT